MQQPFQSPPLDSGISHPLESALGMQQTSRYPGNCRPERGAGDWVQGQAVCRAGLSFSLSVKSLKGLEKEAAERGSENHP